MSLKSEVEATLVSNRQVTFRPAALYLVAATPIDLFHIVGGPVHITALTAHLVAAITTAVTWHFTIDAALLLDAALFAAIGAINTVVAVPLEVGAALIAPARALPVPSILAAAFNTNGIVATPGDIELNLGGAADIDGITSFSIEWYRLSPAAEIIVA